MMKTRSKALYAYLLEAGVLKGTPEAIDCAKCEYRKLYKKHWKQKVKPRKEIRIEFTLKQFAAIKSKAHEYDLKHTTYSRLAILAAVDSAAGIIPHLEQLEKILQLVSMAVIGIAKNTLPLWQVSEFLEEAETVLIDYLKKPI